MPSQKLSLQQRLLQKLSPQQIQVIKLLEIPTMQLEQRIKKELEENRRYFEKLFIEIRPRRCFDRTRITSYNVCYTKLLRHE